MGKTFSVAELGHGGASRAIREAQDEPVLVSKENRPAAWIVSADKLTQVAAARGADIDVYQRALELIAVELYRSATLTLGQGAKLAGLPLGDFIDLCGRLHAPVLWAPAKGVRADVDALETMLQEAGRSA